MAEDNIEELSRIYSVSGGKFEEYKKVALLTITTGKRPSKDKTLIVVGGQSGAGKSRVIPIAKQELEDNVVVVDFDELRSLHPNYQVVNINYSEITHRILHPDTDRVKDEILKELIQKEYNVIYEGALRNTPGFLEFARDFRENGYKIKMYLMAVPKLESYGSTFLRYSMAHITGVAPRWVEKPAHDGSYDGVIRTTEAFIKQGMVDDIHVFVRGKETPQKIYTTQGREFPDALTAIQYGRESGRKKAVQDYNSKYKIVTSILKDKEPEKLEHLMEWQKMYQEELEYFAKLGERSPNRN